VLNEEFSAAGLNTALWTPGWQHGGISGPVAGQCMSSSNVIQSGNGYLYLELKPQANVCEGTSVPDTGALVESNPGDRVAGHVGFAYAYGYVEWRVYIPGVGVAGCPKGGCLPDWPALWSLPENHSSEIDTMEGLKGPEAPGQACFHLPPPFGSEAPGACASGSYAGWHTFGANWEPGAVTYYYDGVKVGQISASRLSGLPQYLVMEMKPTGGPGGPLVVPDTMVVDYVRVWQGATSAFQASNDHLWTSSPPTGWHETPYGMESGTSPSINGSGTTAFHANGGQLWTYSPATGGHETPYGMAAGTSPSINRNGEVAFQANGGHLWTYSPITGGHETSYVMAAGTSPSINDNGEVAFQDSSTRMWTYSASSGGHESPYGMAAGTSPSINRNGEVAFQANTTNLWTVSPSTGGHESPYGMAAGTSPSFNNAQEVAFQANTTRMWTYTLSGGGHETPYGMAAQTSGFPGNVCRFP
jgi:hypothetical protein